MIKEFDNVIINSSGIEGTVIDIYNVDDLTLYAVESKDKGVYGGWGLEDGYKIFTCREEELKKV